MNTIKEQDGCKWVLLTPADDGRSHKTIMAIGVSLNNGRLTNMGDSYTRSLLPCPSDCGDTGNYLVDPPYNE